jgi:hypothetical protein
VSHHPPISAFHIQGSDYESWGHTHVSNYFWGGSLMFKPFGLAHFKMTDKNHHYVMQRPDNSANNLLMSKIYLDVHGKSYLNNLDTGEYVDITYFRHNWSGSNNFRVEAEIKESKEGKTVYKIEGHWNKKLKLIHLESGREEVMWECQPSIQN